MKNMEQNSKSTPSAMTGEAPVRSRDTHYIARVGMIAAVYAAATLVTVMFFGQSRLGPDPVPRERSPVRFSGLFTPAAVPGLTLGCAIANIANISRLSGTGMLGMLDVVFGSLATFVGASITWKLRRRPAIALMGPVLANALIVPAYLPLLLQGIGFYNSLHVHLARWYLSAYVFLRVGDHGAG